MAKLADMKCSPVDRAAKPLEAAEAKKYMDEINGWVLGDGAISREFSLKNFSEAITFVGRVAALANAEDHHPDIHIFLQQGEAGPVNPQNRGVVHE